MGRDDAVLRAAIVPIGVIVCGILNATVAVYVAQSMPAPERRSIVPTLVQPTYDAVIIEPEVIATIVLAALPPPEPAIPETIKEVLPIFDDIDGYLCEVYDRTPAKKDNAGDFTWKDPAAARRMKMNLCAYAIGGIHRDFREQLYAAGREMDRRGIRWSVLSGFRDDYRQGIASGIKARKGYSMHGGSKVTKGHGDGRAVDLIAFPVSALFRFIDTTASQFGLYRPYKGFDPNHVQPSGNFQKIAHGLRFDRTGVKEAPPKEIKVATKYKKKKVKTRYAKRHKARA